MKGVWRSFGGELERMVLEHLYDQLRLTREVQQGMVCWGLKSRYQLRKSCVVWACRVEVLGAWYWVLMSAVVWVMAEW